MNRLRNLILLLILALLASACASTRPAPGETTTSGLASWYGEEYAGRTTANGEIFDPNALTAAHRTLPFGTIVNVTNPANGRSVKVRINDRGPFINNRIIDISYAAAKTLDMIDVGVTPVVLDVLQLGAGDREPPKPYVVTIAPEPAAQSANASGTTGTTAVPAEPPPVEFPLPPSASAPEDDFTVQVVEEKAGEVTRKQVAPDGTTIQAVPIETPAPANSSTAPRPEPPATGTPGASWMLQIGAFSVEQNARDLKAKAGSISNRIFIETSNGLHRVRVGPFSSKVEAIEMRERLEMAGFPAILLSVDPSRNAE